MDSFVSATGCKTIENNSITESVYVTSTGTKAPAERLGKSKSQFSLSCFCETEKSEAGDNNKLS
jgi:hypothetical protein